MKMNLQYFAEDVEDVTAEQAEADEAKDKQDSGVVAKDVFKERLDRKERQHQKEVGALKDTLSQLKEELEEIKTSSMPEEERKSYKQQKAEKEENDRIAKLEEREKALQARENAILVKDSLSDKGVPQGFVRFLVETGEFESLEDKLEAFTDYYTQAYEQGVNEGVKKALSGKAPRVNTNPNQGLTKEQFKKMDYHERVNLRREKPELYEELSKGE